MKSFLLGVVVLFILTCLGCGGSSSSAAKLSSPPAPPLSPAPPPSSRSSVKVTITSPQSSSPVPSTFSVTATASSTNAIAGWQVSLDGANVYAGPAAQTINTNLTAAPGNHQLVVQAWDTTGVYGSQSLPIVIDTPTTMGGSNGLPSPPSNAQTFTNIEQLSSGWGSCNSASCAGGSGNGTYWMAQNQASPARDGSSTEFFNSGVWENALFFQKLGANNSVHNFLWDFYFYVDSNSQTATQALEFDAFQFVNGYNYMIGSQCNYGAGVWDTWEETTGHWIHTSISCPKFSPNTWHHIQWYETTDTTNHQYSYVTLVVDGNSNPVNVTGHATNLSWSDNMGVQWQLDDNAGGEGYHEWVDSVTLTVW